MTVSITVINSGDLVSDSRAVINSNFAALAAAIQNAFIIENVSGTINSVNTTFTVATSITQALLLVLANTIYQPGTDFTTSGTTITYAVAPDISLAGQPHWLIHS